MRGNVNLSSEAPFVGCPISWYLLLPSKAAGLLKSQRAFFISMELCKLRHVARKRSLLMKQSQGQWKLPRSDSPVEDLGGMGWTRWIALYHQQTVDRPIYLYITRTLVFCWECPYLQSCNGKSHILILTPRPEMGGGFSALRYLFCRRQTKGLADGLASWRAWHFSSQLPWPECFTICQHRF